MLTGFTRQHSERILPNGSTPVSNAGWAPGQLAHELARGSWHVLPANEELVFAEDPSDIWRKLVPPRQYRAGAKITESGPRGLFVLHAVAGFRAARRTPSN